MEAVVGETGDRTKEGADGTVKAGIIGYMWQLLLICIALCMIL
jgi:hypothetical protein